MPIRLYQLAKYGEISIAEFDAETRFRALAAAGSSEAGLALLDKLDAAFVPPAKRTPKKGA